MSDLISREALIEYMMPYLHNEDELEPCVVIQDIKIQPGIDAVPVVHGKWIPVKGGYRRCSRCKIAFSILANAVCNRNFCPNCGAKMDGRKEN